MSFLSKDRESSNSGRHYRFFRGRDQVGGIIPEPGPEVGRSHQVREEQRAGGELGGREVKTLGDGLMAAFPSADWEHDRWRA